MTPLVLDFETYFDKDLTLKKLNYTEYVAKTHVLCVSTLHNRQLIGTHNAEEHLTQFDWPNILLIGHNLLFDALVLKRHFNIEAGAYLDTLGMARLLHPTRDHDLESLRERYLPNSLTKDHSALTSTKGKTWDALSLEEQSNLIAYCKNDTLITAQLYELWKDQIPEQEAQIMDHTIKLWLNPVLVLDAEKALIAIQKEQDEVKHLLQKHKLAKETIRSDQQFYNFLETKGVTPPTQFSKKQQKHIPAFSKTNPAFQQFYHEHPELHELLDLKRTINSNIKESRTANLIRAAELNNGRIPVAYNYCGAFTARFSGANKNNLQNLPRGSLLRDSIVAPEGHILVVCDLAQIEARVLAWIAGEDKITTVFSEKRDLYSEVATQIYGFPVNKKDHPDERWVGKTAALGLGYSMSATKFQIYCQIMGRQLEPSFCEKVVETYRTTYFHIPELWKRAQYAIHLLQRTNNENYHLAPGITFHNHTIILPSQRKLSYEGLNYVEDEQAYRLPNGKKVYGALIVENCIAAGTLVLTQNGWKLIENITKNDLVHDGLDFVNHGGLLFKSVQACVTIDGVQMTPDHEVLTNEGWTPASQSPQPYRPNIRSVNGYLPGSLKREKSLLALSLSMWQRVCSLWSRCCKSTQKTAKPELWLRKMGAQPSKANNSRNVQTPRLRSMAKHDRPLPTAYASGISQLWGAWHNSMRRMADRVYSVLGGYERHIPTWAYSGANKQQPGLFTHQLQMGHLHGTSQQSTEHTLSRNPSHIPNHGNTPINPLLSPKSWSPTRPATNTPQCSQPVYDIVNCGPNQRFVVKGDSGPFIVHNCVQAIIRDILVHQLLTIHPRYPIIMHTHDELITYVPENEAETARNYLLEIMRTPPPWIAGIPLDAEANFGKRYGDCK